MTTMAKGYQGRGAMHDERMSEEANESDAQRMAMLEALLTELVQTASVALGSELVSVLLFGSAAEGRLRANSDVNVLMLVKSFDAQRIDLLREPLRLAHAAARVEVMFLREDELPVAAELFAVKFNDIRSRHRLLYGSDPVQSLSIDPVELRRRLREVLLNLSIRLRERYALVSLREEQLARVLAEAAGPLRAAAVAVQSLQGKAVLAPREALEAVALATQDEEFIRAVALLPLARAQAPLPPGVGGPALLALSRLAGNLRMTMESAAS
jgi:predicted nucleotidyltransferase